MTGFMKMLYGDSEWKDMVYGRFDNNVVGIHRIVQPQPTDSVGHCLFLCTIMGPRCSLDRYLGTIAH